MKNNSESFVRRALRDQRGQVLPWVIFGMIGLLGIAGISVDVGKAYAVRNQLQNAVNAAALAGAADVYNNPNGTNNPIAVGIAVTHGCIRLYPDDVAALFALIRVGTPVRLIDDAVKVAWVDGELLLEAHPPVDAQGQSFEPDVDQFSELLRAAVGDRTVAIHWDYAREVLQKADGVLATVGLEAGLPVAGGAL